MGAELARPPGQPASPWLASLGRLRHHPSLPRSRRTVIRGVSGSPGKRSRSLDLRCSTVSVFAIETSTDLPSPSAADLTVKSTSSGAPADRAGPAGSADPEGSPMLCARDPAPERARNASRKVPLAIGAIRDRGACLDLATRPDHPLSAPARAVEARARGLVPPRSAPHLVSPPTSRSPPRPSARALCESRAAPSAVASAPIGACDR